MNWVYQCYALCHKYLDISSNQNSYFNNMNNYEIKKSYSSQNMFIFKTIKPFLMYALLAFKELHSL